MCNNCIHKIVCSKYIATGGVKSCEHHKEERKGEWEPIDHDGSWRVDKCSACHRRMHYVDYDQPYAYCPNCGADMRGTECE